MIRPMVVTIAVANTLLQFIGGAVLLLLLVVICTDVASRYFLSAPFRGVTELVEQAIVVLVFLSAPAAIQKSNFVRSGGFLLAAQKRSPGFATLLLRIFALAGSIAFGLVAWAVFPRFVDAFENGLYVGAIGVAAIPTWPGLAAILIGSILSALSFLLLVVSPE